MSRVLDVAFGAYGRDSYGMRRTGRSYFREVSTRKRRTANLAFDLAPPTESGLYLSATGGYGGNHDEEPPKAPEQR